MSSTIAALLFAFNQQLAAFIPGQWSVPFRLFFFLFEICVLDAICAVNKVHPVLLFIAAAGHFNPCQRELDDCLMTTNQQDPSEQRVG